MKLSAANLNHLWGALVVEELVRQGITCFAISPGSRSTPLTVAAARNPAARTFLFHDERGAGFFALGYARACARPAALICTSGTAGAHYLPAVVEAHMDGLPLIILQADRPPELQETGANQTVPQSGMFQPYLRWQFVFPAPQEAIPPQMVLTTIDQAVQRAHHPWPGPVQLVFPFREPLAPRPEPFSPEYAGQLDAWMSSPEPWTRLQTGPLSLPVDYWPSFARELRAVKKGLVVAGRMPVATNLSEVAAFLNQLGWPVLADVTSGLRGYLSPEVLVAGYEFLLAQPEARSQLQPEAVLHLGSAPTSKRLLEFLHQSAGQKYWLVHPFPTRIDPNHQVRERLVCDLSLFARALKPVLSSPGAGDWTRAWVHRGRQALQQARHMIRQTEGKLFTEAHLMDLGLARALPGGKCLFLGSSMPVRDADFFLWQFPEQTIVAANRGTSGIDGHIAQACGLAQGSGRQVVAVVGDLAFLHDVSSLAPLAQYGWPVVLLVINNHGGGIFHFLPIAQFREVFETYFATPQHFHFHHLAAGFGIRYSGCRTVADFAAHFARAMAEESPLLLEVEVDREENARFFARLWAILAGEGKASP